MVEYCCDPRPLLAHCGRSSSTFFFFSFHVENIAMRLSDDMKVIDEFLVLSHTFIYIYVG